MRIAVVGTGYRHIRRGIETWAKSLAAAMNQLDTGVEATFFCGSGSPADEDEVVVRCAERGSLPNRALHKVLSNLGGWRYGCGSPYAIEQTTFALGLLMHLRRRRFRIVHLQDPWLAWLLERASRRRWHPARVILANGTGEEIGVLDGFQHVQELSPHFRDMHDHGDGHGAAAPDRTRHMIPNFVDTKVFSPRDRLMCREQLGLPRDAFIVLCVGAIKRDHKETHVVATAFRHLRDTNALLVLAGSPEDADGKELIAAAEESLGRNFRLFENVPHPAMPLLYSAADLLVHCSRNEVFGIVFLEAMASGIPCIGHEHPTTKWIIGDGGSCIDMTEKGALATEIQRYIDRDFRSRRGAAARARVLRTFSTEVVVPKIAAMYRSILPGVRARTGAERPLAPTS